ncbi:class I SAM-dependent methyltransferase [Flammeovirga aprica]|uniref:Class I SAM-dependent methyltransferase n=1 Tax=Flammeovirga aprica JL-4 TaxID=694437 RepID=A0A7X9S1J6_9BACT|nr:class I SAM-dependent methyltransferase [Flammeovirga aprica]NME72606.1 class I SAM-dependent methyltransferase [Flammeovirga aprica JL-4]
MQNLTEEELQELEKQLSCPDGDNGINVGNLMNESNINMTLSGIDAMPLQKQDKVLELGHGNCGHLYQILDKAEEVDYTGLEISETMWKYCKENYTDTTATFLLYEGQKIPFDENTFDFVLSVNNVYFWSKPLLFIKEIEKVLKIGGSCVISFAQKNFMEKLPFVRDKFKLYDDQAIRDLVADTNLQIESIQSFNDVVKSKLGDNVDRAYGVAVLKKLGQ